VGLVVIGLSLDFVPVESVPGDCIPAASRAVAACAVTVPLGRRLLTSRPTRKAHSRDLSLSTATCPRGALSPARAESRDFLEPDFPKRKTPYPSVPEAVTGPTVAAAAFAACFSPCATWGPCEEATRPITTVEIACLKMSCS